MTKTKKTAIGFGLLVCLLMTGTKTAQAKKVVLPPERVVKSGITFMELMDGVKNIKGAKDVIFYVKILEDGNIYLRPIKVKDNICGKIKTGDIYPVFGIIGTPDGVFYKIGENAFILKEKTDVVIWK